MISGLYSAFIPGAASLRPCRSLTGQIPNYTTDTGTRLIFNLVRTLAQRMKLWSTSDTVNTHRKAPHDPKSPESRNTTTMAPQSRERQAMDDEYGPTRVFRDARRFAVVSKPFFWLLSTEMRLLSTMICSTSAPKVGRVSL